MNQLAFLKSIGGPFTDTVSVDMYLQDGSISEKDRIKRMKIEVQVARDTSLSIPKSSSIFRIRKSKTPGEKSRELKPEEFGQNLKTLLDKKLSAAGKVTTIATFMENLSKIS